MVTRGYGGASNLLAGIIETNLYPREISDSTWFEQQRRAMRFIRERYNAFSLI